MNAEIKEGLEQMQIEKRYKDFFEAFSSLVNNSVFNYDGAEVRAAVKAIHRQHRYLQSEMIMFILRFLQAYGKGSGDVMFEDGRNQWALSWAKKATEIT